MKQHKTKKRLKIVFRNLAFCFLGVFIAITGLSGNISTYHAAMAADTTDSLIYMVPDVIDAVNNESYSYVISKSTECLIIPMSISNAGFVDFSISLNGLSADTRTCFTTSISDLESMAHNAFWIYQGHGTERTVIHSTDKEENFYFVLLKEEEDYEKEGTISINISYTKPTTGREIQEGEQVYFAQVNTDYYKFTLANDSQVIFKSADISWEFKIFNSSKESLGYTSDKQIILRKGVYYVSIDNGMGSFSYTTKKLTLPSNTTKKKAKAISLGKKVTVVFPREEKSCSYFYKLKLSKTKKISIKNPPGSGYIYNAKGKLIAGFVGNSENTADIILAKGFSKKIKLTKGTYYIKMESSNINDNMTYSFIIQ